LSYTGHVYPLSTLAWSPDGQRIASGGMDRAVQVWDAQTGNVICTYREHTSNIIGVAWSPDGKHLASAGSYHDATVRVWDASTGNTLVTYRGHPHFLHAVAWSPDGQRIASVGGAEHGVQVWDAFSGSVLSTYRGHVGEALSVAWSPDGKRLVSYSGDGMMHAWKAGSGVPLLSLPTMSMVKSFFWWVEPALQRDWVGAAGIKGDVAIWDVATGERIYFYGGTDSGVNAVAWSPDGEQIVRAAKKTIWTGRPEIKR
jgi:WD40 repeat protein